MFCSWVMGDVLNDLKRLEEAEAALIEAAEAYKVAPRPSPIPSCELAALYLDRGARRRRWSTHWLRMASCHSSPTPTTSRKRKS